MTDSQRELFLRAIDAISAHNFWKAFCTVLYKTKFEIKDIVELKWKDILFCERCDYIQIGLEKFPINKEVMSEYKAYREELQENRDNKFSYVKADDYVFGNSIGEKRSLTGLSHTFKKFLTSKNIVGEKMNLRDLRVYAKTIVSQLHESESEKGHLEPFLGEMC